MLAKIDSAKVFQFYLSTVFMISGTDKFFNFLTYWPMYLAPQIPQALNIDATTLMYGIGIAEFAVGILLWLHAKAGGVAASLLLFGIAINLLIAGKFYNIVLIDVAVAICATALAQTGPTEPMPELDSTF